MKMLQEMKLLFETVSLGSELAILIRKTKNVSAVVDDDQIEMPPGTELRSDNPYISAVRHLKALGYLYR